MKRTFLLIPLALAAFAVPASAQFHIEIEDVNGLQAALDNASQTAWPAYILAGDGSTNTIWAGQYGMGWLDGRFTVQTPAGPLQMYMTGSPAAPTIYWPGTLIVSDLQANNTVTTIDGSNVVSGALPETVAAESLRAGLRELLFTEAYAGQHGVPYVLDGQGLGGSLEASDGTYIPQVVVSNASTETSYGVGRYRTPAQFLGDIAAAPLASPALTGTPTAPTAAVDTNTTQLATTAFAKKEADDAQAASQPLDTELTALAGLTSAADTLPYFTGSGTAGTTTITSLARTFLAAATATAAKDALGATTGVWPASSGGTNNSNYTVGDLLYASATSTLSKLPAGTSGQVLTANGAATAPSWQTARLTATAALDFSSIAGGAQADLTVTVTGASAGDAVVLGLPAAPDAGLVFNGFVSATNTVTVRASNITGSPVDPASATFRATVLK